MEEKREESIRKGPWKEEEDEVVINHVKKYGPKDWSSIRSKGLLQRTGKSCRLRWVNKLRPNLKNGCKFSAEEERVVIELQAQFGNKWAKIATYLHGRTDNDVKNFWSSRQKRLARILHNSAATSSKSHKIFNKEVSGFTNVPSSEDQIHQKYCCSSMEEKSISEVQSCSLSNFDNYEMIEMVPLPDQVNPKLVHFDTNHVHLEDLSQPKISNYCTESQLQVPQPQQDMTLSEGNQPLLARFEDLFDMFGPMNGSLDDAPELAAVEQLFLKPGTSCGDGCQNPVNPDVFFDDFPTDMFDQIEPLPSPSDW